jgi:hypothetical protein
MKKLLVVFGIGLLFASCSSQPNFDRDDIPREAMKELQSGHADTLLVVKTDKHDYIKCRYSYFKTDKYNTFEGSIRSYNDHDTAMVVFFILGIFIGMVLVGLIFNN